MLKCTSMQTLYWRLGNYENKSETVFLKNQGLTLEKKNFEYPTDRHYWRTQKAKATLKELESSSAQMGEGIQRPAYTLHKAGFYRRMERRKPLLRKKAILNSIWGLPEVRDSCLQTCGKGFSGLMRPKCKLGFFLVLAKSAIFDINRTLLIKTQCVDKIQITKILHRIILYPTSA